jgi:hypothetical protein
MIRIKVGKLLKENERSELIIYCEGEDGELPIRSKFLQHVSKRLSERTEGTRERNGPAGK